MNDVAYFSGGVRSKRRWDTERKILVWRGIATANVKKDATKNEKRLEKAFEKLMKEWEEMYGGRARALRKLKAEQGQ